MLKVFLVEDESVIREGLRDNIPWKEYGFEFVGEAGDGEVALPLIRKTRPDLLITDIKMPFMNGLTLCHIVRTEFPAMKVIVMSGYDDFEYAKRAITEGVEQYLSKPITSSMMKKALGETREKIENERRQQGYTEQYQLESREYEKLQRRNFLENVFDGKLSVEEIYEGAGKLSLNINASSFNLILFSLQDRGGGQDGTESENYITSSDEVITYFIRYPEYIFSRWSLNTYCVVVKGDTGITEEYTKRGLDMISESCKDKDNIEWYECAGKPVERFSELKDCFTEVNRIFSCRFWIPEQHMITEETARKYAPDADQGKIENIDAEKLDPQIISGFLENGQTDETEQFISGYLSSLQDGLASKMFRDYLMLTFRFNVLSFVRKIGVTQEDFFERAGVDSHEFDVEQSSIAGYVEKIINTAISYRDEKSKDRGSRITEAARKYIEENYSDPQISLNTAAAAAGVSPSYFSATFSRDSDKTFVECLTQKRMEKACELIRQGASSASELAEKVGYKDSHYFSFVFRKTQGMTPREYKAGQQPQ